VTKIGLLCSSGGSAVASAFRLLREVGCEIDAVMVTDRECPAESVARELGFRHHRFEITSRDEFSNAAASWFYSECGVDWVCLFFQRLVSAHLFERERCANIHPSLLPSFPGLRPLQQARSSGARFFGATAHLIDESIDGGPILAQVISPLAPDLGLESMKRISFAQKVYLLLVLTEQMSDMSKQCNEPQVPASIIANNYANPMLVDTALSDAFVRFVDQERIPWVPRTVM